MSAPAADGRRPLGGLPAAYAPTAPQAGAPNASTVADPVRFCVFTTVALLAWVFGPVVVAAMAGLGLVAYVRAVRGGLTETRCVLQRPWLVLFYLGWACAVGAAGAGLGAWRLAHGAHASWSHAPWSHGPWSHGPWSHGPWARTAGAPTTVLRLTQG